MLGDDEGGVVRQHDAAGADADARGAFGDEAEGDGGGGAGDADHVVVLGHPVAVVAELFGVPGEVAGAAERVSGRGALGHGGEVENREGRHALVSCWERISGGAGPGSTVGLSTLYRCQSRSSKGFTSLPQHVRFRRFNSVSGGAS